MDKMNRKSVESTTVKVSADLRDVWRRALLDYESFHRTSSDRLPDLTEALEAEPELARSLWRVAVGKICVALAPLTEHFVVDGFTMTMSLRLPADAPAGTDTRIESLVSAYLVLRLTDYWEERNGGDYTGHRAEMAADCLDMLTGLAERLQPAAHAPRRFVFGPF